MNTSSFDNPTLQSRLSQRNVAMDELFRNLQNLQQVDQDFERDTKRIHYEINQLDKGGMKFLTPKEINQKYYLQSLLAQRNATYKKEQIFQQNVKQLKQKTDLDPLMNSHNEIQRLLLLKEQIQTEKDKFLRDLSNKQTFQSAGMQVLQDTTFNAGYQMAQQKLHRDQAKLQYLKSQHIESQIYQDKDEVIHGGPADNVHNEAKFIYKGSLGKGPREQLEQLTKLREQLEQYNQGNTSLVLPFELQNGQEPHSQIVNYQNDIEMLRQDYVKSGGTDPLFLLKLSQLEQHLSKKGIVNRSASQPNSLHVPQQINNSQSQSQILSQLNASHISPQMNQSQLNLSANGMFNNNQMNQLSTHPIFDLLPKSFQSELMNLSMAQLPVHQQANQKSSEPQSSDDMTLDYLRQQEAELLLRMSRLDARSSEHATLMLQYKELLHLRAQIEKSIFDRRVAEAIAKEDKYKKSIVKSGFTQFDRQSRAENFSSTEGLVLFFDYISNLQIQYHTARINYGIFRKGSDMYPYKQTRDAQSSFETYRTNKVVIFDRDLLRDLEAYPDTYIFIELWGYSTDIPEVIGWSMLRVFNDEGKLIVGRFRIPLYSKVLNPNFLFKKALPYVNSTLLYGRVCLPQDPILDSEDVIVVENEYNMPELHIHNTGHMTQLAEIQEIYLKEPEKRLSQNTDLDRSDLRGDNTKGDKTFKSLQSANQSQTSFIQKSSRSRFQSSKNNPTVTSKSSTPGSQLLYESTKLIFRLVNISRFESVRYPDLKLKLGVFVGANLLTDADNQVQMALKDLQPTEFLEDSLQFSLKHEFSIQLEQIIHYHNVTECMLFMGFFKNQKELFGWNAVPLFENDPDTGEHRLKLGAFQMNMLSPPGQSPPFQQDTMKKSEIEIGFVLMTPKQNIAQLKKYDTYVDPNYVPPPTQSRPISVNQVNKKSNLKKLDQSRISDVNNSDTQLDKQEIAIIKLILESVNFQQDLQGEEFAAKIAMVDGDKFVYDINDKKCAINSPSMVFQFKKIQFNFEIVFEVNFKDQKNSLIDKNKLMIIIYIISRTETITWYAIDVSKNGRYQLAAFNLPWQKPPINKKTITQNNSISFIYDMKSIKYE